MLNDLAGECSNTSDRLYEQLFGAIQTVETVGEVADDPVAAIACALGDGEPVLTTAMKWSDRQGQLGDRTLGMSGRSSERLDRRFQAAVKFAPLAPAAQ